MFGTVIGSDRVKVDKVPQFKNTAVQDDLGRNLGQNLGHFSSLVKKEGSMGQMSVSIL